MADLTWKPALYDGTNLFLLPRPVTVCRIRQTFDFGRYKVPLENREHAAGRSANGLEIHLEGQALKSGSAVQQDEKAMFNRLADIQHRITPDDGDVNFQLFLYHDTAENEYRSVKACQAERFEFEISDHFAFRYVLDVFAADPNLYVTAPA